jgi:hypothetical protein
MKTCLKCHRGINEDKDLYCMTITKKGSRVIEFESFHVICWKEYIRESIKKGVLEMIENDKKERGEILI